MPEGMRWNFHFTPSRTIVCPALLPPWKRITRSACSASRSVILPFPSSPHWAPTTTIPAIAGSVYGAVAVSRRRGALPERVLVRCGVGAGVRPVVMFAALIVAEHGQRLATDL